MKKLTLLFIFLAALLPERLLAEPIVVLSGEHDTFTRLVMRLPVDVEWRIEENAQNRTLLVSDFNDGFDLSSAFEIIPRTRLKALVARDSQLELQLACDCQIEAFLEQNRFLVIDIANSNTSVTDEIAVSDDLLETSDIPDSVFAYGDLLWSESDQTNTSNPVQSPREAEQDPLPGGNQQGDLTENELVSDTQERLLAAFSSAASRGILTTKSDVLLQAPVESSRKATPEIFDSSKEDQAGPIPLSGNMRISDSRDIPGKQNDQNVAATSTVCVDPSIVDIATWGTASGIGEQVGASVLELYDQAGRLNKENVLKHARLQLFFGLGQEAKQTLKMFPRLMVEHPELLDIANILEFGHANNPRILHRFPDCNTDLALWGLLAAREIPLDRTVNATAALRGLQKLPNHLKFFLAPSLSERFSSRGDAANASIAIRSFENLKNHGDQPKLVFAEVSELRNKPDEAKSIRSEIVTIETSETPQAIIELIDMHVEANEAVPAELALLAETYAFQLRGTEEGLEMFRAFVLSTANSGQQEKALNAMEGVELDDALKTELISSIFSNLSNNSGEIEFLESYFTHLVENERFVEDLAMLGIAKRLFNLGFETEAEAVLEKLPNDYLTRDSRLLKARVLLSNGDFDESYNLIQDLTGADAALIKGEAMKGLGQMELAASYFSTAETEEVARDMIWLSDNWRSLLAENDDQFGSVRSLANETVARIPQSDQMISNGGEALAASANARQTLERLLADLEYEN